MLFITSLRPYLIIIVVSFWRKTTTFATWRIKEKRTTIIAFHFGDKNYQKII
jgi:hypothetical protein